MALHQNGEKELDIPWLGGERIAVGIAGLIPKTGANQYYPMRNLAITKKANGIEISWECLPGVRYYRVDYADALSLGMTWNTFPEVIDGDGLERAMYLDQTAGGLAMRFYRVTEAQ